MIACAAPAWWAHPFIEQGSLQPPVASARPLQVGWQAGRKRNVSTLEPRGPSTPGITPAGTAYTHALQAGAALSVQAQLASRCAQEPQRSGDHALAVGVGSAVGVAAAAAAAAVSAAPWAAGRRRVRQVQAGQGVHHRLPAGGHAITLLPVTETVEAVRWAAGLGLAVGGDGGMANSPPAAAAADCSTPPGGPSQLSQRRASCGALHAAGGAEHTCSRASQSAHLKALWWRRKDDTWPPGTHRTCAEGGQRGQWGGTRWGGTRHR